MWLLPEAKPAGAPSGTKEGGRILASKRGPGGAAALEVREDNGTPPAPLVLTLESPPPPVLPSPACSAGLRRGGRGPAGNKGHLTSSLPRGPQLPRDPLAAVARRREGEGRVLSTCHSLPRKLSPKPGARIWRAGDAGLEAGDRAQRGEMQTRQVFPVPREATPPAPGPPEMDRRPRKPVAALQGAPRGASGAAACGSRP